MELNSNSPYALELQDVNHHYGTRQILFDLNLKLPPNRIYGLLGRNGAGKTTLINLISAQIFQTFGRLGASNGRDPGKTLVFGESPFENINALKHICVVREKTNIPDPLRVYQAINAAAMFYPNWDAEYAQRLLDRFSLDRKKRYRSLSRGMESALGLVIGLASRAELTIFDEPSLGLDAAAREYFYDELIHDFDAHPRTVIISTHMIDEVSRLFEDVIIMDHGRIKLHMPLDELLSNAVTVAGTREEVERQTSGLTLLHEETLSGALDAQTLGLNEATAAPISPAEFNNRANTSTHTGMLMRSVWVPEGHKFEPGVELYPIPLQKLFVYLTEGGANI